MAQDYHLFSTPSIETHLLSSTAVEVDKALEILNEEGQFPSDPAAIAEIVVHLVARFSITQVPGIDDTDLTFHNDRNQVLTLKLPVRGNIYFLTYQVRSMPPPVFQGTVHVEDEAGLILLEYKLKAGPKSWEAGLDEDMAMLRTYVSSIGSAITAFNGMLHGLIESKINDTLAHNRLRIDIAAKMAKRGFEERPQ